ncbi:MAG: endonuclease III [Deltaproteobacteria bacterium RIFCSPHIGHO2_02_FULL_60_17]|nr:MAG: endonuclease III [Deltaproteobacteria bacterium RIFCSPHIGHO2_02_FULL_60_17]
MKVNEIHPAIRILRREVSKWQTPIVTVVAQSSESPFHVLISCILSLRTQDATTAQASRRLFALANTPAEMLKLTARKIEKAIFPVGFYRTKAKNIRAICRALLEKYSGKVPDEIDELLKLKGVGRKTANLVVTLGYRKPGICVDTHVHRISNRWGYVRTKNPKETEFALRAKLPTQYWIEYNDLLVTFGQHLCRPISPMCSRCQVKKYCARVGVGISR